MVKRRRRPLPRAEDIADRGPWDKVERSNGHLYLMDTRGYLAPVRIRDDETTGWPAFVENCQKLTKAGEINQRILWVARYPWMTPEAKQKRIQALRDRWRQLFGDAMFVVDE